MTKTVNSKMEVRVTGLEVKSGGGTGRGSARSATITITDGPGTDQWGDPRVSAAVGDLPSDMRDVLRRWLGLADLP